MSDLLHFVSQQCDITEHVSPPKQTSTNHQKGSVQENTGHYLDSQEKYVK